MLHNETFVRSLLTVLDELKVLLFDTHVSSKNPKLHQLTVRSKELTSYLRSDASKISFEIFTVRLTCSRQNAVLHFQIQPFRSHKGD